MKIVFCILLASMMGFSSFAQSDNPRYERALADSLGGDEYGMKSYVLVLLKTGARTAPTSTTDSLVKGHIHNIVRLAALRKLVVAGPLGKNDKSYEGIFILNVPTIDEARTLLATDPLLREGFLDAELFQWYGSAALPEYLPIHDRIQRKRL